MNEVTYLGERLIVLRMDTEPGWVWCLWPHLPPKKQRVFRHWHDQLEPA